MINVLRSSTGAADGNGHTDSSPENYYYTDDNKRVTTVRPTGNTMQVFYVYGAKGEIAAICTSQVIGGTPSCDVREPRDLKFAGRVIRQNFLPVTVDRLGSVVANPANGYGSSPTKYYLPYGEQLNYTQSPATFPGNANFATYLHDESTGLNYADQRFYHSGLGRFISADPVPHGSFGASHTWNQYSYATLDPVNLSDPSGLCTVAIAGITQSPDTGPFTNTVVGLNADSAYPFAGQGVSAGASVVLNNDSGAAATALAALQYALTSNTGSIDVIAYSGGASAFTNAYGMLSAVDQARIGIILYVSPGANGLIASNATTFAVTGVSPKDVVAGLFTQFPLGLDTFKTSCGHQDFACLALNENGVLARLQEKGDCSKPETFIRNGKGGIDGFGVPGGGRGGGPGTFPLFPRPPEDLPDLIRGWEWVSAPALSYRFR